MKYDIKQFQTDCDTFNEIAGKAQEATLQSLQDQFMLIESEVAELRDEVFYGSMNSPEHILNETLDVLVTTLGLLQQLELAGIDVNTAMQNIAYANHSKFPAALMQAEASVVDLAEHGVTCSISYNEKYGTYVIKDANNKVRKPLGFVPVDNRQCIPDELIMFGFN